MSDYYLIQNQQQVGPLTRETVLRMLDGGEIGPADLAWRTGLDAWRPLGELLSGPGMYAPPTGGGQWDVSAAGAVGAAPINWIPAFAFHAVTSILVMGTWVLPPGMTEMVFQITLPVALAAMVFWGILHYQLWKSVPHQYATTTAGRAVGFLFIPFFNLYWAFISWPKLSDGFEQIQIQRWGSVRVNTKPFGYIYATTFVAGWLFLFWVPGNLLMDLLSTAAGFVFFIFFYRPLVHIANTP